MLTRRLIALTLVVVAGTPAARAHLPSGITIEAFQFPDGLTPVVDGDLTDWPLVGPGLTLADFTDLVAGSPADPLDLEAEVWVGWNDSDNRLYVAARVRDDIHQVDRPEGSAARIFQDDDLEIFLDPDHSGGQYADYIEKQLLAYRRGERASGGNAAIMQGVAANLSDKEIKAVANYISGLN